MTFPPSPHADPRLFPGPGPGASRMNHGGGNVGTRIEYVESMQGNVFHNESIYYISEGASAEEKYRKARECLDGIPRMAEKLSLEALQGGHESSEVAYYCVLAILSGRSSNELNAELLGSVDFAMRKGQRFPPDEWRNALDMISLLLGCVADQDRYGAPNPQSLQKVLGDFNLLSTSRQDEIRRHLDMILNGAIQDVLDMVNAEWVARERMGRDREKRAWKFFVPDPAAPRGDVAPPPQVGAGLWAKAVLGGIGLLLGLVYTVGSVLRDEPAAALLCLLLFGGGGFLAVRCRLTWTLLADRLRAKEFEHDSRRVAFVPPGLQVPEWFVRKVFNLVDARFADQRRRTGESWDWVVAGVKETLKTRLVRLYSQPVVEPPALDWLIRWHAAQAAERWRAGTVFDYRKTLRPPVLLKILSGLGTALAAAGVLVLFTARTPAAFTAAFLLALGGYFTVFGGLQVVVRRRRRAEVQAECNQLFRQEKKAYEAWMDELRDRPSDAQMARWLELDTLFLKAAAMRRSGLANRDLIAYVALTQGAQGARRARVLYGPVRYSEYVLLVFLLTGSGVRDVEVDLNFLDGSLHDERRMSFRYDSFASARVAEVGVRPARNYHQVVPVGNQNAVGDQAASTISQAFQLSLVNGQEITVLAENFDDLIDEARENRAYLRHLALDTSGIASALYILEAVAAEGREWIHREHERRQRRWWDRDRDAGMRALGATAQPLAISSGAPPPGDWVEYHRN